MRSFISLIIPALFLGIPLHLSADSTGVVIPKSSTLVIQTKDGMSLSELIGKVSTAHQTSQYSVAEFTLAEGHSSHCSYNRSGDEVYLILSGSGKVSLDGTLKRIHAGDIVEIPAQVKHFLIATSSIHFYALCVPAFSPENYVEVK